MRLTDEEKKMQDGEYGEPVRIAMDILIALGEIYGAEKMIPISSAHCAGLSLKTHGIEGMKWAEDMAELGARVRVPTTMNVIGVDRSKDLGLPSDWVENQLRIEKAYEDMGCKGTSTCVPYYCGFLPRYGEHIAWAESSAVVFTNSVIGARDNREGGPSALAAGIAGRTPYHGLHLDENRKGDILLKINTTLSSIADYGAMGNYIGKLIGEKVPVIENLGTTNIEDIVYFGSALASAGGVALFHALGITPEARDKDNVFAAGKKYETVELGEKELEQGYSNLTSAKGKEIDYIAIGCPHCSLNQIEEVAKLLEGKKIKKNVKLWIHTNISVKALAKEFGYLDVIEESGGILTQDLCTILGNPEVLGVKHLATNSSKMAFYAPGSNGLDVKYGDIEKCIDAAITGTW